MTPVPLYFSPRDNPLQPFPDISVEKLPLFGDFDEDKISSFAYRAL
jgi:hypothetical protein